MPKDNVVLPQIDALLAAMKIAETSMEAAEYLTSGFRKILTRAGLVEKYQDMLDKVEEWGRQVAFRLLCSSQPWLGEIPPSTPFANSKANKANKAEEELEKMHITAGQEIEFNFAVNEHSQFQRGYPAGVDVRACDDIYFAWLAEQRWGTKDGVLYETEANGAIKPDNRVNPQTFRTLLQDPEKGLSEYARKRNLDIKCIEQAFSTPEAEAKAKTAATEALSQATAAEQAPNEPQAGTGR